MSYGPGNPLWDAKYTGDRTPNDGVTHSAATTSVPPVIGKIYYTTTEGDASPKRGMGAAALKWPIKPRYVPDLTRDGVPGLSDAGVISYTQLFDDSFNGAAVELGVPISYFGRNVVVSSRVDVYGYDYLGQPMTEDVDGTTGLKAFYVITGQSGSATLTWGTRYGLPYAMTSSSGASPTGTYVTADTTDPARDIEGDPRGTVDPTGAHASATEVVCSYTVASANLHGVRHFK